MNKKTTGLIGALMSAAFIAAGAPAAQAATSTSTTDFEGASITTTATSAVLKDGTFSGILSRMNNADPSKAMLPVITTEHRDAGQHALKARIAAGATYSRSEMTMDKATPLGTAEYNRFDMYVPATLDTNGPVIFHQVWQTSCGSPVIAFRFPTQSNDSKTIKYEIMVRNNQTTFLPTKAAVTVATGTIPRESWQKVAMSYKVNPKVKGGSYIVVTVGGTVVANVKGIDMGYTSLDTTGMCSTSDGRQFAVNTTTLPKVGLYRSGYPLTQEANLFFDNVTHSVL